MEQWEIGDNRKRFLIGRMSGREAVLSAIYVGERSPVLLGAGGTLAGTIDPGEGTRAVHMFLLGLRSVFWNMDLDWNSIFYWGKMYLHSYAVPLTLWS